MLLNEKRGKDGFFQLNVGIVGRYKRKYLLQLHLCSILFDVDTYNCMYNYTEKEEREPYKLYLYIIYILCVAETYIKHT